MRTARALFHRCRRAGIHLAADGHDITYDAPADVEVPLDDLRRLNAELLAVLLGDYLAAAWELAGRVADETARAELARRFDEQVDAWLQGGLRRGEAHRRAYAALARAIERSAAAADVGRGEVSAAGGSLFSR